jgi:hypothetical protein
VSLLGGLFFLLLGAALVIYSISTGRHLTAGMAQWNRDRRPRYFWFFVGLYALFAVTHRARRAREVGSGLRP